VLAAGDAAMRRSLVLALGRLSVGFLGFLTIRLRAGLFEPSAMPVAYAAIFAAVAVSALSIVFIPLLRRGVFLLRLQLVADVVVETALVYATGGAASPLIFLYLVTIALGAAWLSTAAGLALSATFAASLAAVISLYHHVDAGTVTLPYVTREVAVAGIAGWPYRLALNAGVAVVLSLLGGQLARTTRRMSLMYRPILENMDEGVLAVDRAGRVLYSNDRFLRMMGVEGTPEGHLGGSVAAMLRSGEQLRVLEMFRDGTAAAEFEMECPEGLREVEARLTPLRDARGREVGSIMLLTDLTLRRQMDETRRRAQRLMELEEVSASLAHELRNPLASIRGCAQQLARLEDLQEPHRRLADIITRESDRLDAIVSRFMDLSRPEAVAPVRCDLNLLLTEVVQLLRGRDEAAGVEVEGGVAGRIVLHCDPERMRQVFLNIGINALEAMQGHGRLVVRAEEGPPVPGVSQRGDSSSFFSDGVLVHFTDTGPGVRARDIHRVFAPFFTTKTDGVGLGLAIANKIVAEHGGTITVRSEFGKGATFTVWLPRVPRPRMGEAKWRRERY